ncbi:MAG: hypothetical protein JXQ73_12545 [Phycisphaerae bacterium]|nr:hypothetical protein [Phycisphaerae bacterium]
MTKTLRWALISGFMGLVPLVAACDAWTCWLANAQTQPSNPNFARPSGPAANVPPEPVFVATSPDSLYAAVTSYDDEPNNLGTLSLVDASFPAGSTVSQLTVGTRPYGVLWVSGAQLLVCNEGLAGTGGTVPLELVTLYRGSNDPNDPNYDKRRFGDPNDSDSVRTILPSEIVGPSVAALVPGTNAVALVTLRFAAGLYMVNLSGDTPSAVRLLPSTGSIAQDPLDEPRGIAITPDGTQAWICNYGKGANQPEALTLSKELVAAKLNLLRGVTPDDPTALQQTVADADQWIADNPDPDGRLPYRWPEPNDGPDAEALVEAMGLAAELYAFNVNPGCTDANDANCPYSSAQWATVNSLAWPTEPNADPNSALYATMVLGEPNDANDPNERYEYETLSALLNRETYENGTITVYSLSLQQVVGSVVVPPRPNSIRFTSDGTLAVIACSGNDGQTGSVVVASTAAQQVAVQRFLPFVPAQVRINIVGGRAYVSGWTGNQMAVLNLNGLCTSVLPDPYDTRLFTVRERQVAIDTVPSDLDTLWTVSFTLNQAYTIDVFEGTIRVTQ